MKTVLAWLRKRSKRGLVGLGVAAVGVILLAGGGVYAALGGFGQPGGSINLQQGLVGWWKLNGNTKDSTPYGDNGTINGGVTATATDREGAANAAYSFNGASGSYITAPRGAAQQPAAQITLSIWADVTGSGTNSPRAIIVASNSSYIDACFSGKVLFSLMLTTGQKLITGGSCPALGSWHLYTATYDGATAKLYVDGQQVASAAYSDPVAENSTPLYIGQFNGGGYTLNGAANDVRLYNRAINAGEVAALYNGYSPQTNLASGENGLVGWWKFNGNEKDSTPYGDNATLNSGTVTATTDRMGTASAAYAFSTGYNSLTAGAPAVSYPGLTLSAWIYPTSYPSERSTIIEGQNPNAYYLSLNSDGSVQTYWYGRNPEGYFSSGAGTVPLNQWSHVAAVWNGSSAMLYVNGVLKSTTPTTGTGMVPTTLVFGAESSSRQFVGSMGDLRIYNQALSTAALQAQYNSYNSQINLQQAGPTTSGVNLTAGLIGYWPLSGNAKDITPYQHNGTLVGSPTLGTDRFGNANDTYTFNGSGQYIDNGNSQITGTQAFTLSAWLDTTQVSRYSGALTIGASGSGTSAYIGTVNIAQSGTSDSLGGGFYGSNYGSGISGTNQWHMVTMTFTGGAGGTATIYVDGVSKVSTTASPNLSATDVKIGRIGTDTTYDFSGSVSDVRIYNRALSATEVAALYNLPD